MVIETSPLFISKCQIGVITSRKNAGNANAVIMCQNNSGFNHNISKMNKSFAYSLYKNRYRSTGIGHVI